MYNQKNHEILKNRLSQFGKSARIGESVFVNQIISDVIKCESNRDYFLHGDKE